MRLQARQRRYNFPILEFVSYFLIKLKVNKSDIQGVPKLTQLDYFYIISL